MTTALLEIYDALREAGASEERSRAAAEAVANYEGRLGGVETDLVLLKWMVGANVAMTIAVLVRLFVA